jgi:Asp-tRNA(Asn)/Glu-tRNA(Gln) amidotransferase C subunit
MVEARALFEELLAPVREDARQDTADTAPAAASVPDDRSHRAHVPAVLTRRHAKGS